jgi:hypothetical protein
VKPKESVCAVAMDGRHEPLKLRDVEGRSMEFARFRVGKKHVSVRLCALCGLVYWTGALEGTRGP